jgi:glycosyltransferase involved in cell wall biosynthesis
LVPGLVSVVIPTYNHRDFIHDTLNSVVSQSYNPLEIIVTDDGSSDGTQDVIREFAERYANIVPVLHPTNTGIPSNMNRGRFLAKGEFLAWLGGDDLMLPGKIAKQVEALRARPDAVVCCHDAEVFESSSGRVLGLFSELYNGVRGFREGSVELLFDADYFMLPSTMLCRMSAMPEHGLDERVRYVNDWLHDVELFRNGKCIVIDQTLGRYRRHKNNVTGNKKAREFMLEDMLVALAIVETRYPELHHYCLQWRAAWFQGAAARALRRGNAREARLFVMTAMREGALIRGGLLLLGILFFKDCIVQQSSRLKQERSKGVKAIELALKTWKSLWRKR